MFNIIHNQFISYEGRGLSLWLMLGPNAIPVENHWFIEYVIKYSVCASYKTINSCE